MTALLSLSDLNTTINHEPRVRDLRLAAVLGMADLHKVRELIVANLAELKGYGEVSAQRAETSAKGGRPGVEYWLNEPQALLLCMFSRTERAAEVRKALIDVFMAHRRGQTVQPTPLPREGNVLIPCGMPLVMTLAHRINIASYAANLIGRGNVACHEAALEFTFNRLGGAK